MNGDPDNSTFSDFFLGPGDDLPKLMVYSADGIYYPYNSSTLYSSIFISSIFFFVIFILLVAAIIQCKRSTRIPHEEFALIPTGPVPGYMTIVHTHPNGASSATAFQLYPKRGSASRHYSDRALYRSEDAPPSYHSMIQDPDLPTYQSVQQTSSDSPSTTASRPGIITAISNPAPKQMANSSNPFLGSSNSATTTSMDGEGGVTSSNNPFLSNKTERLSVLSESESFTDDEMFYEVDTCTAHAGQSDQSENDPEKKCPESEVKR